MRLVVVIGHCLATSDGPGTAQLCHTRLTAGTLDAPPLNLGRRQSTTTAGAPTDHARVCLAAPPPASITLFVPSTRVIRASGSVLVETLGTGVVMPARCHAIKRLGIISSEVPCSVQQIFTEPLSFRCPLQNYTFSLKVYARPLFELFEKVFEHGVVDRNIRGG